MFFELAVAVAMVLGTVLAHGFGLAGLGRLLRVEARAARRLELPPPVRRSRG